MRPVRSVLAGLAVGVLFGLLIAAIALDHNPQGEFADPVTGVYTGDLYMLFATAAALRGFRSSRCSV